MFLFFSSQLVSEQGLVPNRSKTEPICFGTKFNFIQVVGTSVPLQCQVPQTCHFVAFDFKAFLLLTSTVDINVSTPVNWFVNN